MDDIEKAVKDAKGIIDGIRFDNLDQQKHIISQVKKYRKEKVGKKDLTQDERLILLEIQVRMLNAIPTMYKKLKRAIYIVYVLIVMIVIDILILSIRVNNG